MPSNLNAPLLSAVMLAALLLCAHGAPTGSAPTDNPADDSSGEEEVKPTDVLCAFKSVLDITARHQNDFAAEFHNALSYDFLDHYKISSLPARCPASNFSKEACLQRLVEGLQTFTVLLKYVESEYPINRTLLVSETKYHTEDLIKLIKDEMKNPQQVTVLTSSQEKQLLNNINNFKDTFQRKMTAHSILRELHLFLVDGKRAIVKRQKSRASVVKRNISSVHLYHQILKR